MIELDSVCSMTEVESDQSTSQMRLTSIFAFYSAMNKGNDDLGGGKTLQTNCSANLCCGSDGPGTARRVFDPGGLGALPQINEAAGAKARFWPAQIARRATVGACLSYVEKLSRPAGCITWQQGCCGMTVVECNIKKASFQRFL